MPEQEHRPQLDRNMQFQLAPGEQLEVSLAADGMVTLYLRSRAQQDEPTLPEVASEPEPAPVTIPIADQEVRKQERVSLGGLVGRQPVLHTSPKGRLVTTFPLAVHPDQDTTNWYHVVLFDKRAERVRDTVNAGDSVQVIGYRHERRQRISGSETGSREQIYAVAVRHRNVSEDTAPLPSKQE